jgi:hypothetical protein
VKVASRLVKDRITAALDDGLHRRRMLGRVVSAFPVPSTNDNRAAIKPTCSAARNEE